jgi:hypothetical protein
MNQFSSLPTVVSEITQIDFAGTSTMIPFSWFKYITTTTDGGKEKPHQTAITILSDIVYWYKASVKRTEESMSQISYHKKFKSDKLQKSYDDYAELLGVSKRESKAAFDVLVALGLITREFRTLELFSGVKVSNVMFIEPNANKIREITYQITTETMKKIPSYKITQEGVHNFVGGGTPKRHTNTETTTKTTTKTTKIISSGEEIKNNHISATLSSLKELKADSVNKNNIETFFKQLKLPQNIGNEIGFIKKQINTIFKTYDISVIVSAINNIKEKLENEEIVEYNIKYFKNALNAISDKVDVTMTKNSVTPANVIQFDEIIKKYSKKTVGAKPFHQWCLDTFGTTNGHVLTYFYTEFLTYTGNRDILFEKRKAQVTAHTSLIGVEKLMEVIKTQLIRYSRGALDEFVKLPVAFESFIKTIAKTGVILNDAFVGSSENVNKKFLKNTETTVSVKVWGELTDREFLYRNNLYTCDRCGEEIRGFNTKCPSCHRKVVNVDEFDKRENLMKYPEWVKIVDEYNKGLD